MSFNDPGDDPGTKLELEFHLVGSHYNKWKVHMNQYCDTLDMKMLSLCTPSFDASDCVPITVELVIGKLNNADKHAETLEDELYNLFTKTKENFQKIINPRFYVKDGNLVVGFKVPAPVRSALKRTPMGSLEIPEKIQKLLIAIDQKIKYSIGFGATVDDILSEEGKIVDFVHKGFKLNAEFELISNVKTSLIKKIREDEATKQYGDILAYCAPLFLLQFNSRATITFKDKEAIMGNPVG